MIVQIGLEIDQGTNQHAASIRVFFFFFFFFFFCCFFCKVGNFALRLSKSKIVLKQVVVIRQSYRLRGDPIAHRTDIYRIALLASPIEIR